RGLAMQVSVESTGALERKMTIEVPEERIEGEVKSRLKRIAKTARIDGFRPGKIPMSVVKQQYGSSVRADVVGEVIQSTYYEALGQENIQPAGMPNIEPKDIDSTTGLEYVATFEVMPEVKPAPFSGEKLEQLKAEVADADIDKMMETLQNQRASWDATKGKAKDGYRLTIDFEGTVDGEAFNGNSGTSVPVTLGGKRMIEGFEEGLVGTKAGEELTLDLTFPEDYAYKEVASKPVQFAVTVNAVEKPNLPKLDDDFAKDMGIEDGSIDTLRAEIKTNMARELEQRTRAMLKEQVLNKIVDNNEFELPKALIDNEAQALLQQMQQQMHAAAGKGVDLNPEMFEDEAKRRVQLGLLIAEIIKQNELKADGDKIREKIDSIAATYEKPEDVVNYYYEDDQRLKEIESLVLEEAVIDWAIEQADVEEVEKSYGDIMLQG
ncbi:MAG: trigger factor, partial [Gammaproteobacteria bacterium]|nr:trigger factor [Gammaproteobacteria bacterium]